MSLYGAMNTSVSGMNAQTNRLASTGENIANASTLGYKRSSTTFSTMVWPYSLPGTYSSGAVDTNVRRSISEQGQISYSTSKLDMAIIGSGFFVVEDASGMQHLTRAGDFQEDDQGYLLNSSGYRIMGYPSEGGGLQAIRVGGTGLTATPSTSGIFDVNLPIEAEAVTMDIVNGPPSSNSPTSVYTKKISETSENALGEASASDIYFTKLGDNSWEVTTYVTHGSAVSSGFPYDLASGNVHMATTTLSFNPTTGALVSGNPKVYPDPTDNFYYDFSKLLQGEDIDNSGLSNKGNFISTIAPIDTAGGARPASANVAGASYMSKSTFSGYAGLSEDISIDQYITKTGANTWEVAFYNTADATGGGFPYGTAGSAPLAKRELTFDPTTGALVSGGGAFELEIPGAGSMTMDFSDTISVPDYFSEQEDGVSISLDLPSSAVTIDPYLTGNSASQNLAGSSYTSKSTITVIDNAGAPVQLDVYYSKGPDNMWEVSVFAQSDSLTGGFPYGVAGSKPLASAMMIFDPSTNKLTKDAILDIPIPGGQTFSLDMSGSTQLASDFVVGEVQVDGRKASMPTGYSVSPDGMMSATYEDGTVIPLYTIALADVMAPDRLTAVDGTAFLPSVDSGPVILSAAGMDGLGKIQSGAVENSNVDIADELTTMIESQRVYTANSKVFQTGSEMYDVLNNLKR